MLNNLNENDTNEKNIFLIFFIVFFDNIVVLRVVDSFS